MSVFLRWGVFGILGVAALLYAYNASKRMAEVHASKPQPPVSEQAREEPSAAEPVPAGPEPAESSPPQPAGPPAAVPANCEAELTVAKRALEMKQRGEPLDRVLRMQEIAWEESPDRRKRLELVATRYYGYGGSFSPAALRSVVINDCQRTAPAP
jgi:hypothetical protein